VVTNDRSRRVAGTFGATKDVSSTDGKAVQKILDLTRGAGVDVVAPCQRR
jgi:Zn-dependent alcohol dehydrogenase